MYRKRFFILNQIFLSFTTDYGDFYPLNLLNQHTIIRKIEVQNFEVHASDAYLKSITQLSMRKSVFFLFYQVHLLL